MASIVPSRDALRVLRQAIEPQLSLHKNQLRHATLLRRPKRPYTFTQLVTLSDGSTFLHRTTSPSPVYKSTKDQRNTPLWNPSSQKLLNVEEDEAGKLAAFRERFGRGWDVNADTKDESLKEDSTDHLLDLISGQSSKAPSPKAAAGKKAQAADAKAKPAVPAAKVPGGKK